MQNDVNNDRTSISAKNLTVSARKTVATAEPSIDVPPRRSAASLIVPRQTPPLTPAPAPNHQLQDDAPRSTPFDRLRALRDDVKPHSNQPDLAIVLIQASISEGICRKGEIVSTLVHLGLNNRFAGVMVDNGVRGGRWRKGVDGCYYVIDQL